jgi:hypothetical protein
MIARVIAIFLSFAHGCDVLQCDLLGTNCRGQVEGLRFRKFVEMNMLKVSQKMQPVPPPVFIATKGQPVIHRSST